MADDKFEIDYFISRRGTVAAVAKEVASVLDEIGIKSFSQDHDIPFGANFIAEIHKALKRCRHFIALVTADYDESEYTQAEWTNFYAAHVKAPKERRFIVVLAEPCKLHGLFEGVVYANLAGITDPQERRSRIIAAVEGKSAKVPHADRLFENVPNRDLNFTGRDERLAELHKVLSGGDTPAAITAMQAAIHGLGGIGKTTLATEYAYRYAGAYAGVWWAPAEQRTSLIASLATLAARLDPKLAQEPDQEKAARAALSLLAHRSGLPYLLVYDNAESPETLKGLLPTAGARLLITTRHVEWGGVAREVKLDVFAPAVAEEFLQKRTQRNDATGAARLAGALGYLPLALDHAGAYCRLTATSFDAYGEKIGALIAKAPKSATHPSVFATFDLAIEKAASDHKGAETLLGFFAYLAPERIPLDLVDASILTEDERADALATLSSVSLIELVTLDDDMPSVTLHRLVQSAMRARLETLGETTAAVGRVARRLATAFPEEGAYKKPEFWLDCAALLPHVQVFCQSTYQKDVSPQITGQLLDAAGCYLYARGAYNEAEPIFRNAVAIGRKIEPKNSKIAEWSNNLAMLLRAIGRYEEAEPLYRETIAIGEKAFGREHPDVARRLNNLANLLGRTNRHAAAEVLYREAIAIDEKIFGREHPEVATDLNNLALLLEETGRYADAEALLREALAIRIRSVGPDHLETALSRWSIAGLLFSTQRASEALPYAEAALTVYERVLGTEHPSAKDCARDLAYVLTALGRNDEAAAIRVKYGVVEEKGKKTKGNKQSKRKKG